MRVQENSPNPGDERERKGLGKGRWQETNRLERRRGKERKEGGREKGRMQGRGKEDY